MLTALLATAVLVLATAQVAQARSSYCSPSGDYCSQVGRHNGKVALVFSTFSFRGKVTLCVTAPDHSRSCKKVRLLSVGKGVYRSTKGWRANFPSKGRGVYRVSWSYGGSRVGLPLTFRVR